MHRKTLLTLVLIAASTAQAANFYHEFETVSASDYDDNPDYRRFSETCGDAVQIKTNVSKLKSSRPQIDAVVNHDAPTPDNLKAFVLDSIKEFYEEGDDKESLCTESHNYETVYSPSYLGHHNQLEQLEVFTSDYLGGAHESFGSIYYIFDERDHRLTLADILQGDKNALYPLLDAAYKAETGTDPADKNLDKDDRERIKNLHEQTGNFFFAADGLVFSYPPYAVAPFVAGQVELTLPYAQLRGIIKDAYLPQ